MAMSTVKVSITKEETRFGNPCAVVSLDLGRRIPASAWRAAMALAHRIVGAYFETSTSAAIPEVLSGASTMVVVRVDCDDDDQAEEVLAALRLALVSATSSRVATVSLVEIKPDRFETAVWS